MSASHSPPPALHRLRQQLTPPSASEDERDATRASAAPLPSKSSLSVEQQVEDREAERRRLIRTPPCPTCNDANGIAGGAPKTLQHHHHRVDEGSSTSLPPTSSQIEKDTVMPFLTQHIPNSYAPTNAQQADLPHSNPPSDATQQLTLNPHAVARENSKFCYRHSPDTKCHRQTDEPSMQDLQTHLSALPQSDQQAISHVWSLFSAAPSAMRNLMLQGILSQCCFPQLSYINGTLRDLIKIDFLGALPAELGFKILCYLDTASLCRAAQVSQRWRALADDDVVWHKMCEQHIDRKCTKCGWGLPLLERKRLRNEKRQIQLRATGRGLNQWSPAITPLPEDAPRNVHKRAIEDHASEGSSKRVCFTDDTAGSSTLAAPTAADSNYFPPTQPTRRPWKDVYKARFKVGTNWKHGRFTTRQYRGHTASVMCLQFNDNILITGSSDCTARVWDLNVPEETALLRVLKGHTRGIRCLQFDDSKLMTGSLDNTIKLWSWKTGECLRTFHPFDAPVLTLHFSGVWVASGSTDNTIRVWNSETQQTFLLRGHTDSVNSVRVDEASRTLFSASDDLTIRHWDLDTKQCRRVFEGHVAQISVVLPMPAEFELEEHQACKTLTSVNNKHRRSIATPDDDDASSVASGGNSPGEHRYEATRGETPGLLDDEPFWPHQPDRPAPPRYMLTASLDGTIRTWSVWDQERSLPHAANGENNPFPSALAPDTTASPPAQTATTTLRSLPTDPLTNSHVPRATSCLRCFFGHIEGIWALAADHLRIVSGSEDSMVKIWNASGKCERTIAAGGSGAPVTCVGLSGWGVAAGGEDAVVRVLCFGDGEGNEK